MLYGNTLPRMRAPSGRRCLISLLAGGTVLLASATAASSDSVPATSSSGMADAQSLWRQPVDDRPSGLAMRTAAGDQPVRVTVEQGDSLWLIAERIYGDPTEWPRIYAANKGRVQPDGGRFVDPDFILPGQQLDVPPVTGRQRVSAGQRVSAYLSSIQDKPAQLREFFHELPKGGDLHNHLSGAASTELLIKLAGQDGMCIDMSSLTAYVPPCKPGSRPAADAHTDAAFQQALLRAWSMQDFPPGQSAHDHFFDAFGKFGAVAERHRGALLADVANTAARQNQFYLETMVTPASDAAKKLADSVGYDPDFASMHQKLTADGKMDRLVAEARLEADRAESDFRSIAHCQTRRPDLGCRLPVRWISQVSRGSSLERVFTQIVLGMRLSLDDDRFVAVNLVQPEDGESALRNYRTQMRMLDYLHGIYPRAHITLHAGELVPGLVKPEDLTFHIHDAVITGKAERIGHGIDLRNEDSWWQLANIMSERGVAVEVPFTSNKQILGVAGSDHPFTTYRTFGVPVVLSTDDPGISRTDLSHEYQYAAQTYSLTYPELKDLARASLEYAFLPGSSLWRAAPNRNGYQLAPPCQSDHPGEARPTPTCAELLSHSPKAAVQWRLEAASTTFEAKHGMPSGATEKKAP
ncbi:LysM peptidoglycan-binding domain-containing protein [Streptomyces violascens]|uniref:LysM peptidoglycan-binding domain-containing protein n=1 Tax=Streptomyces violascens TaxID=67381 RepID=UPI0036B11893